MSNRESQRITMPVMFVECGRLMNAIKENKFSIKWNNPDIGAKLFAGD